MAKSERDLRRAPLTDETPESYKAGTQLHKSIIGDSNKVHLFRDLNEPHHDDDDATVEYRVRRNPYEGPQPGHTVPRTPEHIPKKVIREEKDPDVLEGIDMIGGGPGEVKEIDGEPITREYANLIQRKEAECGYPTGKGSLSARAQSAAAANEKKGIC